MKTPFPYFLLGAGALALAAWSLPLGAQSADPNDQLLPLVQAIVVQQKTIDDNQANIDKSLATIQENLRQAKIYIGRAGGKSAK